MSLPSQSARPKSRYSHMYSRKRYRGFRRFMIAVAVTVVAALIWWYWPEIRLDQSMAQDTNNDSSLTNGDREHSASDTKLVPRDAVTQEPVGQMAGRDAGRKPVKKVDPPMAAVTTTLVMGAPLPANFDDSSTGTLPVPATTRTIAPPRETMPGESARPAGPERSTRLATTGSTNRALDRSIASAMAKRQTQPVEVRLMLSQALQSPDVSEAQRREIRSVLTEINDLLVFSPAIVPGDPFVMAYTVQKNDYMQKIVRSMSVQTDWRLVARVNRVEPKRIRGGQTLKLITGPFHAVVNKSEYRLDLYLGDGAQQVFVRSFDVGLGQYNSTPQGLFRVRPKSKAINPAWVNPRTGEAFDADDPNNPIGDYWIGLEGVDTALANVSGYGIHGTTEPQSIGQQASMGCIRLGDDDIALIYEVLVEEASLVRIVP